MSRRALTVVIELAALQLLVCLLGLAAVCGAVLHVTRDH